jgi:FkbM family methyltransferase
MRERVHPPAVSDRRLVETASGLHFRVDLGTRLGSEIFYGFVAELFDCALFMEMLEEGVAAADVGANFGLYTLFAARRVGPTGRVYAFEPDPGAFELLSSNAKSNGLSNVVCHEMCVAEGDGQREFYLMVDPAFSGLGVTGRSRLRETRVVTARRLDSALGDAQVASLSALKIDVEGYEFGVLGGARQTIERSREIVMMVEVSSKNLDAERKVALEAELGALYAQGFTGWVADPGSEGLRAVVASKEAVGLGSANLFLVRSGSVREKQLLAAGRQLRRKALTGITSSAAVEGYVSLSRRKIDEASALAVQTALFAAAVGDRENRLRAAEGESEARLAEIRRLTDRALEIEQDSQLRLREIHALGEKLGHARHEIERTRSIQQVAEREGRERLQEIEQLRETTLALKTGDRQLREESKRVSREFERVSQKSHRRLEELKKLQETMLAVEADSRARLGEIHRLTAEVQRGRLSAQAETAARESAQKEVVSQRGEISRLEAEDRKLRDEATRMTEGLERQNAEIRERLQELTKLQQTNLAIEADSNSRLLEIHRLTAEVQRWRLSSDTEATARGVAESQISALTDDIRRLEEEGRRLRDDASRLSEEIQQARREAERPLPSLVWRRIRRRW